MFGKAIFLLGTASLLWLQPIAAQNGEKAAGKEGKELPKEVARINSGHAEVRPLITEDGNTLYFCRRYHPGNVRGDRDFQDVWVSYRDTLSNEWSEPVNLGPVINNKKRNAIASISPDGKDGIFFNTYKKTRRMPLVRSRKEGENWSKPEALEIDNYINVSDYADFYMDFRNKVLLLAIEGDSGAGDQDLYISFPDQKGGWQEPINLGTSVNTEKAEFAPFMGPDGRSLFFCSYGHEGQGGSDIYMSVRLDESWLSWSEPVSLGPSINTPDEETYFSVTGDFENLYYSSYQINDKNRNILEAELPEDFTAINGPVLVQLDSSAISRIMLSGNYHVSQNGSDRNFQGVRFEGWPESKEQQTGSQQEQEGFLLAGKLSPRAEEIRDYLLRALPDLELEVRQKQDTIEFKIVQNFLYDFNSVYVSGEYLPRLNQIVPVLRERPELKIQLIGHTDNVGPADVNKRVAEMRVQNLMKYFRNHRIEPTRMGGLGVGQSNPLLPNQNKEGRKGNRRVETIIQYTE